MCRMNDLDLFTYFNIYQGTKIKILNIQKKIQRKKYKTVTES